MWSGANRRYDQWAARINSYLVGLNAIGIKASVLAYDDQEAPQHGQLEQMIIGGTREASIKIWEKNINYIELWRTQGKGGAFGHIYYLVRANVGDNEKEFHAKWYAPVFSMRGGKKGYQWQGGSLANALSSDLTLRGLLLPYQREIVIKAEGKHQFVTITENRYDRLTYSQPDARHLEAMDRLAGHIKMKAGLSF